MKFDWDGANEALIWAAILALLGVIVAGAVWAIVKVPAVGIVLAYFALACVIGGFWPRRK